MVNKANNATGNSVGLVSYKGVKIRFSSNGNIIIFSDTDKKKKPTLIRVGGDASTLVMSKEDKAIFQKYEAGIKTAMRESAEKRDFDTTLAYTEAMEEQYNSFLGGPGYSKVEDENHPQHDDAVHIYQQLKDVLSDAYKSLGLDKIKVAFK